MNNRVIAFDPEEELKALVKLFQRFGHNSDGNWLFVDLVWFDWFLPSLVAVFNVAWKLTPFSQISESIHNYLEPTTYARHERRYDKINWLLITPIMWAFLRPFLIPFLPLFGPLILLWLEGVFERMTDDIKILSQWCYCWAHVPQDLKYSRDRFRYSLAEVAWGIKTLTSAPVSIRGRWMDRSRVRWIHDVHRTDSQWSIGPLLCRVNSLGYCPSHLGFSASKKIV